MATTYTYTVTIPYDIDNLSNNINNSTIITTSLFGISISDVNLYVTFTSALSTQEQSELTNLVNNNSTILDNRRTTTVTSTVRVATTIAGTLATDFVDGQVIDGVTLSKNDLILIKNQSNAIENGIYSVLMSGQPERSIILDSQNIGGSLTIVNQGITNANTSWLCTNQFKFDVVGIDSLIFTLFIPRINTTTQITFGNNTKSSTVFKSTLTNVYTTIKNFIYKYNESNIVRFAIVYNIASSSASFNIRLYDVNNSNQLAIITGLTNTSGIVTYAETTSFTNLPTSNSIFEIQFKETAGSTDGIAIYSLEF